MAKKPAQLSESLLAHRPRKGAALPQTEAQATTKRATSPVASAAPRRRRRRSNKTEQLNLRVSPEVLERFSQRADEENLVFGDLLEKLLDDK